MQRAVRAVAVGAVLVASSGLAACGGGDSSGKPELVWYINPDPNDGQAKVAEKCSTDDYTVTTQKLPTDAGQQRIQLVRRLTAQDPEIDLMSLDPPYTAEFANAGFLEPIPEDMQSTLKDQSFKGAIEAATWEDKVVVYPFWSNTQVLWFRKSWAEKAGVDPKKGLTWDEVIDTADKNGGTVAVQANKYEGYSVWVNALVEGAGGHIVENAEKGAEATVTINDEAGRAAAKVIKKLAGSEAAPSDLTVSNEGTAGSTFGADDGAFMVNWTYIWHNYDETAPDVAKDIGYAPYPQTVGNTPAAPPYGGIGVGVSKYSDDADLSLKAAECIVKPENQGFYAETTGNMPASPGGYDYPALADLYPEDLRQLFQDGLNKAAPRTVSPYWSDISSAVLSSWHPPTAVDQKTPKESATFITDILKGGRLL